MGTNFPGSPNSMDFAVFSHVMGNGLGNPWISHMMKYTIAWESNGKKEPKLRENNGYPFPRLSLLDEFCIIFPCNGKLMGQPMHFTYDEVYQNMGI